MPLETANTKPATPVIDLAALEKLLADAAATAKNIIGDKANHARSPLAASLRSNIDHAVELLAAHKNWIAANPPKAK